MDQPRKANMTPNQPEPPKIKKSHQLLTQMGYQNMQRSPFPPLVMDDNHHAPRPAYNAELELWAHPHGHPYPALEIYKDDDPSLEQLVGAIAGRSYQLGAGDEATHRATLLNQLLVAEPKVTT
jgi:hypothetical protein